jgi:hypothetical protein
MTLLAKVRERLPHYLSHDIGAAAGLSLWHLQQIVAGSFKPTDEQLAALARRIHVKE